MLVRRREILKKILSTPLDKLLEQSRTLNLETLFRKLENNKVTNAPTYIHPSCRTLLKKKSQPKRTLELQDEPICPKRAVPQNVSSSTRSTAKSSFDFKHNCFYCTKDCVYDEKHPDRNMFENVRTTNSAIFNLTREICKQRNDKFSKTIEMRLLNVSDLVAPEAKYHKWCRSNFENLPPTHSTPGRPTSQMKMDAFRVMCQKLEDGMDLYTVAEFHEAMKKIKDGEDVYSIRTTKTKLMDKYGSSIRFVSRRNRSDIILLENVRYIFLHLDYIQPWGGGGFCFRYFFSGTTYHIPNF